MTSKLPDLSRLDGVVAPEILAAMKSASAQLTRSGVPHALEKNAPDMLPKFEAVAEEALL